MIPGDQHSAAAETFLRGGGQLGSLIRAHAWDDGPLGPPAQWPQALKTAVRIMLTSRQPIWVAWGPELTYLYNDPYLSIIGGKHPGALGRPVLDVWREIRGEIEPLLTQAMSGDEGTYVEAQLLIMERNGYPEETYYTFSYSPIPDDSGRTGGIICANTEDTERVFRERQLAVFGQLAIAAQARTTHDACTLGMRALEANPRDIPFALLYLRQEESGPLELAGRAGLRASHPAAPAVIEPGGASPWPAVAGVLATGTPAILDGDDVPGGLPGGAWDRPPSRVTALPVAPRAGDAPAGVLIVGLNPYRLYDASYQGFLDLVAAQLANGLASAGAYEDERRRADALAELDRAKTVFFSNVSHELRTPLTLILGPLDDLRREAQAPDVREQAEVIHRNAIRLLRLVNALLDFSRIEAGRARAVFERVDLAELTGDLASTFRSAIERAGLAFDVDCRPIDAPTYVDRQMWEKVVLNLLSNAFKFTHEGRVAVSLWQGPGEAVLAVRDTGTGVPPEELPRLFERFHRVEGARGRTHEGTGIGLALVQELVRLHGGHVTAESVVDRGSTFTVTIPLGRGHLPAEHVREEPATLPADAAPAAGAFVEEALRWLPESLESREPGEAAAGELRARILLADDNADVRDYVRRVLQPRWAVEAVPNGRAALDAIGRARPDLVVTDVMMPELDGFGLVQALRANPETRTIPVVMLSARAGEEATLDGLQAGADDYLAKPFSARELVTHVEAQLLRARIRAVEDAHARRLASVFGQAPVGVALLRGPGHVYELANPVYLELLGHRDVVGQPIRTALPELADQGIFELLDAVYQSGEPYVGRSLPVTLNRGPEGLPEESFFDFVYQPLFDAGGAVEGIAVVVYEVTELTRARREAEAANRAKDEFLAILGHELRNPLAPILTALQLLRLRGVEAGQRERDVIERQVRHLVTLVDDLLDVSRITRGKVDLQRSTVDLAEVVARAIETASPLLEQYRHELHVDVRPRPLLVSADPARLAQVVANLLTNAAKYTNPGGYVTVAAWAEGPDAVVCVRDTGIGIDPDVLPRVFELFVQEPQALDRARGGLGLGLAIVQSLVRLHGGTITASSDGRGQGAEFTVRLPDAVVSTHAPAPVTTPAPAPPVAERESRGRILVVDDNQDAANLLVTALGAYGFTAQAAYDGPAALAAASGFEPDVAVLDLGLPVMDGYELARLFQDDARLRDVRLIAATGYGQERDRQRTTEAGFAAHLVKPLDLPALFTLLESMTTRGD
ncbi:MAG: ATP-binding protein [Vicinamibacterales bacterium]